MNSESLPSESLWRFALAFYAQPSVSESCLMLQDTYQANVCLIIAMCWLDTRAISISEMDLNPIVAYADQWAAQVIAPLRGLRRALKHSVANLLEDDLQQQIRNHIKQAELLAEQKLLQELERLINQQPHSVSIESQQNVNNYLTWLAVDEETISYLRNHLRCC